MTEQSSRNADIAGLSWVDCEGLSYVTTSQVSSNKTYVGIRNRERVFLRNIYPPMYITNCDRPYRRKPKQLPEVTNRIVPGNLGTMPGNLGNCARCQKLDKAGFLSLHRDCIPQYNTPGKIRHLEITQYPGKIT